MTLKLSKTSDIVSATAFVRCSKRNRWEKGLAYVTTPAPNGSVVSCEVSVRWKDKFSVYGSVLNNEYLHPRTYYFVAICDILDPRFRYVSYRKCILYKSGLTDLAKKNIQYFPGANTVLPATLMYITGINLHDEQLVRAELFEVKDRITSLCAATVNNPSTKHRLLVGVRSALITRIHTLSTILDSSMALKSVLITKVEVVSAGLSRLSRYMKVGVVTSAVRVKQSLIAGISNTLVLTGTRISASVLSPLRTTYSSLSVFVIQRLRVLQHKLALSTGSALLVRFANLSTNVVSVIHTYFARLSSTMWKTLKVTSARVSVSVIKDLKVAYARIVVVITGKLVVKAMFIKILGVQRALSDKVVNIIASIYTKTSSYVVDVLASIQSKVGALSMLFNTAKTTNTITMTSQVFSGNEEKQAILTFYVQHIPYRIQIMFQSMMLNRIYPLSFIAIPPVYKAILHCSAQSSVIDAVLFAVAASRKDEFELSFNALRVVADSIIKFWATGHPNSSESYSTEIVFSIAGTTDPTTPPIAPYPQEDWTGGYVNNPYQGAGVRSTEEADGYVSPEADAWVKNFKAFWNTVPKPFNDR